MPMVLLLSRSKDKLTSIYSLHFYFVRCHLKFKVGKFCPTSFFANRQGVTGHGSLNAFLDSRNISVSEVFSCGPRVEDCPYVLCTRPLYEDHVVWVITMLMPNGM